MSPRPLLALLVAGCTTVTPSPYVFDGPTTAAVLHPSDGGPFEEPVGFVSNARSGRITPLDLKHATLLSDQYGAPYLSSRGVALGDQRQLGEVLAWAPDDTSVRLLVVDLAHQLLVEAPYLVGFDGEPQLVEPVATEPLFEGTGSASLADLELRTGWTTTEDWELVFDGEQWTVTGSRSGRQDLEASTGQPYRSDNREVQFTIEGEPAAGDRLTFSTDSGVVEHDLGAIPLCLRKLPDPSLALVGTWDPVTDRGALVLWDLDAGASRGELDLGEGAQPWEIELGGVAGDEVEVFVADAHTPQVHLLRLDTAAGTVLAAEAIEAAAGVQDLAWVAGSFTDGAAFRRLFVAPAGLNRIDLYDLDAAEWLDVNPLDGVDAAGIDLFAPVVGMAAAPEPERIPALTDWGVQQQAWVVVLSLFDGSLLMMDAATGCLVTDEEGARLTRQSNGREVEFIDRGAVSAPVLVVEDEATDRRVTTSSCGGLIRNETWRIIYDGATADWRVIGSTSGEQDNRLVEDERYVSDNGGFSLTVLSGPLPPTTGDEWTFTTQEGLLRLQEVTGSSSSSGTPLLLPGEPVIFQYDAGPTGGGWDVLDRRTYALLPLTGNDLVLRVWLRTWNVEVVWD